MHFSSSAVTTDCHADIHVSASQWCNG